MKPRALPIGSLWLSRARPVALYTHTQLVKQGVDADLHVWEGMFHGFFYNPDVPESRDCFDVIVRFFATRLGKT